MAKRRFIPQMPARFAPPSFAPQGGRTKTVFLLLGGAILVWLVWPSKASAQTRGSGGGSGGDPAIKLMTYTVKTNDNLFKIAKNTYGDGCWWPLIYDLNRDTIGSNPNKIFAGQVYNIPTPDTLPQSKKAEYAARCN